MDNSLHEPFLKITGANGQYSLSQVDISDINIDECCDHEVCIHCNNREARSCEIFNKLSNAPNGVIRSYGLVMQCDAFESIEEMTFISTEDEMISFIEKTSNFFDCIEDFEYYYGFERPFDDDGNVFESVTKYYKHGGKFENLPDSYPCIVYFDVTKSRPSYLYLGTDLSTLYGMRK